MRDMELLVVSDTHGDVESLCRILAWARRRPCQAMAFLGDGEKDLERAFDRVGFRLPLNQVRGNNDWSGDHPWHATFDFSGRRFFMTHGHLSGVSSDLSRLIYAAKEAGADAALFGHTHRPYWEEISGLLVLNPGSPSQPRGGSAPSFATIGCPADGWFEIHHWNLGEGLLGGRRVMTPPDMPL